MRPGALSLADTVRTFIERIPRPGSDYPKSPGISGVSEVVTRGLFLQDMPLSLVLSQAWPMALIALVTLTLACVTVRRVLA
jgi:hypothetical protein